MFCCQEESEILGMARFEKERIVDACNQFLIKIKSDRKFLKKSYINEYIERIESLQSRWWWFFGNKSRIRIIKSAIKDYNEEGWVPKSDIVNIYQSREEEKCRKILRTAIKMSSSNMWLSPEGVSIIGL